MYINLVLLGLCLSSKVAAVVVQPLQLTPSKAPISKISRSTSTKSAEMPAPQNKETWGNLPRPNPADVGPNSKWFWKGQYGPTFDKKAGVQIDQIGSQIDPAQKAAWDKQRQSQVYGQPIKGDNHKRDERYSEDGYFTTQDLKASNESTKTLPSQYGDTQHDHSLLSRFISLVKRITIGGSMTGVILHPPPIPSNGVASNVPVVYNGQPGMIYLKQKGDITYCNDSSTKIGQYHVYLPSIFFTDVHNNQRCNQPCFLFWVSGRPKGSQGGTGNFLTVIVAGRCNDCYPWEVQAEDAVIEAIGGKVSVAAGNGLWGPTLALGTSDDM